MCHVKTKTATIIVSEVTRYLGSIFKRGVGKRCLMFLSKCVSNLFLSHSLSVKARGWGVNWNWGNSPLTYLLALRKQGDIFVEAFLFVESVVAQVRLSSCSVDLS